MDDVLLPFLIEAVITSIGAFVLLFFSVRQVLYDYLTSETWRALTASHFLTCCAIILLCVMNFDSAGGLGFYSLSSVRFLANMKDVITIASASALATSFLEGYKIMVRLEKQSDMGKILFIGHSIFLILTLILFIILAFTRLIWLSVASRIFVSAYSIIVATQIIHSSMCVRSVLKKEQKLDSRKYVHAARRLTRLLVLVFVLVILGNIGIFIAIAEDMELAHTLTYLPTAPDPFDPFQLVNDFASLFAPGMLIMGAWKTSTSRGTKTQSRKSSARPGEPESDISGPGQASTEKLSVVVDTSGRGPPSENTEPLPS